MTVFYTSMRTILRIIHAARVIIAAHDRQHDPAILHCVNSRLMRAGCC